MYGSAVNVATDRARFSMFHRVWNAIILAVMIVRLQLRRHDCSALFSGQSSTSTGVAMRLSPTNILSFQDTFHEAFRGWETGRTKLQNPSHMTRSRHMTF
jgi:hypothetical protein